MAAGAAVAAAAAVASAAAVAAAAFHERTMSVEEEGLPPEGLDLTLSWAATAGVIIPARFDCGITTPPWSTPPWVLTAHPLSSSMSNTRPATEAGMGGGGGRKEIAILRPPPSPRAWSNGLAGNLAFLSPAFSFFVASGDNASADTSSSSLSSIIWIRLRRDFPVTTFPVAAVAVAVVVEVAPVYFGGARQALG